MVNELTPKEEETAAKITDKIEEILKQPDNGSKKYKSFSVSADVPTSYIDQFLGKFERSGTRYRAAGD